MLNASTAAQRGGYPYSCLAEVALCDLVGHVGAHEHPAVHTAQFFAAGQVKQWRSSQAIEVKPSNDMQVKQWHGQSHVTRGGGT